jgi:hypothetical protein
MRGMTSHRHIQTALLVLLAAMCLAAAGAPAARADDPNATHQVTWEDRVRQDICKNPPSVGVANTWGYFVDGCTTQRLYCPYYNGCWFFAKSEFSAPKFSNTLKYSKSTQNMRLRLYTNTGVYSSHIDRSCQGVDYCSNSYLIRLPAGYSGTVQCNGMTTQFFFFETDATNTCKLRLEW